MQVFVETASEVWALLGEMAPYLLLGFFFAGILHVYLKADLIEQVLGRRGSWSNLKATILGIPLPICSCGVLPLAASLKREGASSGSTVSFLTATPQTGVDSILATHALMGPVFTAFRVAVAFISGLLTGAFVDLIERMGGGKGRMKPVESDEPCCGCCGTDAPDESNCSHSKAGASPARPHWMSAVREAVVYGFIRLPRDLLVPLVIGLLLAALIAVWVPVDWAKGWLDQPLLIYFGVTLLAVPLYVCSTGSIPLAFALLNVGFSPGAALVFLITGPATNAATLGVIMKQMGWRVLAGFLVSLLLVSWGAGFVLDQMNVMIPLHGHHDHESGLSYWIANSSAIVMSALLLYAGWGAWRQRGVRLQTKAPLQSEVEV